MKKIVLVFLLLVSSASAQQPKNAVQQKLEAMIGSLIVENAGLASRNEELQASLVAKDAKIKELEDQSKAKK